MKATDLNITSINSIEVFYELIDEKALDLEKEHEISDAWIQYRNKTESEKEKQFAQWEIEAFLFSFHGKTPFSFSSSNGKEVGQVSIYPDLNEFQQEAFEYLRRRSLNAKSSILKARYNHLLWIGIIKKNKQFSDAAIHNYLLAIKEFHQKLTQESDRGSQHQMARLFESLVGLANESKSYQTEIRQLVKFLLFQSADTKFYLKYAIVDDMLRCSKLFKPIDFENVLDVFKDYVDSNIDNDRFILVKQYVPAAIKIAEKIKVDVKYWYEKLGDINIRWADSETDEERNLVKIGILSEAIHAYRKAGNKEKKKIAEQKYFELKESFKLDEYRIDFDEQTQVAIKQHQEYLQNEAKKLLKESPEYIYETIAQGKFFPTLEQVKESLKYKEPSFLDAVTNIRFDHNKNIMVNDEEAETKIEMFDTYGRNLHFSLLPFLHYVFVYGIKSGKLTFKNILAYLKNRTWIGVPHTKPDLGGNPVTTDWITLLSPSIVEYFVQVYAWGESKYYVPSFILCVDSLTLKIEGLFRNFSERISVSTTVGNKNGSIQEVLLHNVLDNEIINKYFNQDDKLLFDYVLSNTGINLRNNIAHSLFNPKDYSSDYMLLLIAILLRLGKYNISRT